MATVSIKAKPVITLTLTLDEAILIRDLTQNTMYTSQAEEPVAERECRVGLFTVLNDAIRSLPYNTIDLSAT